MVDFFSEFRAVLSSCKKKKVLEGVFSLLFELKKKKGDLWSFDGDNVLFFQGGTSTRETKNERGEFFRCFEETMEVCKKTCLSEIMYAKSTESLKKMVSASEGYIDTTYEIFWEYLQKEEEFL
ncbi:hypothetical protein B1750_gp019 [Noumeavirus]|uniref:Uncharacterized protein n=1 Tax=Marseillevirus sp. TaxID=2809551 RepID=A0AA96ESL8_9VIRU|nr:hypothetical protein B1750_gp019 [Noumeavirus]AQM73000.1 hypothetical protein NMV_019 [Noumeavirus]WNL50061.1 hypothetical protein MarDSR_022 [Marseillevirus sp.]